MKATGIVRRIDDLGRVVIPKEIRRTMRIREGDPLEIFTDREGEVIFKKYSPIGELGIFATQYAEILSKTSGYGVCITDKDNIIAVSGASKKELMDKKISSDMENIIEEKTMYIIKKESNKKLMYYNVNMSGLEVEPINEVPNQSIKVGKVLLVDDHLQDTYIKKRVNNKLNKIINFMLQILNDDNTDEGDTIMVLDEINRLKGIVATKYRNFMKDQEYKALLTKLILIEEEFKKNYNEKVFMSYNTNMYEEDMTSFRGR